MLDKLLTLQSLPTIISSIVTAVVTYLVARHNNRKELMVTDRQQLSFENQQIRQELREEVKSLREEIITWRDRCLELEEAVHDWREKYTTLVLEKQQLEHRVMELEAELKRLRP